MRVVVKLRHMPGLSVNFIVHWEEPAWVHGPRMPRQLRIDYDLSRWREPCVTP